MNNTFPKLLAAALIASAVSFIAPVATPVPAGPATSAGAAASAGTEASAGATASAGSPAAPLPPPQGASAIKGRVDPPDGAVSVLAVSASDTAHTVVSDGMFLLNVGRGTYKLVVVARPPYKTVVKDNVEVAEGNTTDVGTIRLQE